MRHKKSGPPTVAGKAAQESNSCTDDDEEDEHSGEADGGQVPPDSGVEKKLRKLRAIHRDQTQGNSELPYLARTVAYWMDDCMTMTKTKEHYGNPRSRVTGMKCNTGRDGITGRFVIYPPRIVIYPSQTKIARQVGCEQAEVSRAIQLLIANGHYRLSRRWVIAPKSGGGRKNNEYLVLIKPRPAVDDRHGE